MLQKNIVIIGAGISGLALGWSLKQLGNKLTLLEASNRPGGWIQTKIEDSFLFEQGPHSFRPNGTGIATLQLIENLGLQDELLFANEAAKIRYLYTNSKLQSLPKSLLSTLSSPFLPTFLKAIWKDCWGSKGSLGDESIYNFAKRRFGEPVAELFFDALISGIYAGDIKKLSLKACFPVLYSLESQYRSLLLGTLTKKKVRPQTLSPFVLQASQKGIFTLRNGIQTLTDKLAENLKDELRLDSPVKSLSFENGNSCVELQNGEKIKADELFLALPPRQLVPLFKTQCPNIAEHLSSFDATSIAVINFGYHSPVLDKQGFGYLIPSKEKQKLLGVVWDSSVFPEQNAHVQQTRLTAMTGGAHFADFASYNEDSFIEMALKELHDHLGIKAKPDCILVKCAHEAIPQYTIGHSERLLTLENELKKLPTKVSVLGNGYYGVSVSDCIERAIIC